MYKMIQCIKHFRERSFLMYTNCAYLYDSDIDLIDQTRPLIVLSCGTYHFRSKPILKTIRPNGRTDYQLLYIASGNAHFYFGDKEEIVTAGHMILYRPGEEQNYVYYGTDKPEVYWIHFTGNGVEEILDFYEFSKSEHTFYSGTPVIYESLFKEIIRELQHRRPQFEELIMMYLRQLFLFVQRNRLEYKHLSKHSMAQEVELAKIYFHDHYQEVISIENYAKSRHLSICWFIRSFRTLTGVTPLQYLLSIRIENARALLEHTQYNITEIATLVGFDDPLYFSHMFKKRIGISPSKYRNGQ